MFSENAPSGSKAQPTVAQYPGTPTCVQHNFWGPDSRNVAPQLFILHRTLLFFLLFLDVYNRVILQFCNDSVQFLMTKNSQECFEVNPVSRDVTLSCSLTRGFPARCLLCLVKEAIYPPPPPPPIQGSRKLLTLPRKRKKKEKPKPSERHFFNDTLGAQKCEHSWGQLLGSACERGSGTHFVGMKCLGSDWLLSSPVTALNPWFRLPLSPFNKGSRGRDTSRDPDYLLEAGSRSRILGSRVIRRLDFPRCKALLFWLVRQTKHYRWD